MSATERTFDSKQEREREFHNAAFSDGRRSQAAAVSGAYAIIHDSRLFYEGFIRAHAPGVRMLEFGCGASAMASTFGAAAAKVVGIDISDVAVQRAAEVAAANGFKATYQVMDAESLQFPDHSFDLICSTAILHHLDLRKAYGEIARTLAPGGHAIFMEPLDYNPIINLYRRLTPNLRTPDEHPLRIEDLELARQFFDSVEVRYFTLTTLLAIPLFKSKWIFRRLLFSLERFDHRLFRLMPWLRRYAWQVVVVLSRPKHA